MSDQYAVITQPSLLIVDDDSTVILALRKVLDGVGRTRFATNGLQALSMIARDLPDLILLDMEMPEMDGISVCKALKADPATAAIPVLFITSHGQPYVEELVFAAGAADYLPKPLNPVVVAARVNIHLAYRSAIAQLSTLATRDGLTGLYNRRSFDETLANEWARSKRNRTPLALLMVDIDEFKRYNDHFGHLEGDRCLKTVSAALGRTPRRRADMVARYGGEEFAIILPETDAAGATLMADSVCSVVRQLHLAQAPEARHPIVTVSIGGSVWSPDDLTISTLHATDLIASADVALYESKNAGRSRVTVTTLGLHAEHG